MMDEQFSEELEIVTHRKKNKINIFLLILIILIIIISIVVIILSFKLNSKSNDYNILQNELANLKEENKNLKNNYTTLEMNYNKLQIELVTLREENNNLTNKYFNQNDTLNNIFNEFQEIIMNANITNPNIYKENYKNIRTKVKEAKTLPEGTYDIITEKLLNFDKGYQVAFETSLKNKDNYYNDETYYNMVYKLSSILGINAFIAVYDDNPHIGFYFEDKNKSLSFAALFNQDSVWDWSINDLILNPLYQPKYY